MGYSTIYFETGGGGYVLRGRWRAADDQGATNIMAHWASIAGTAAGSA